MIFFEESPCSARVWSLKAAQTPAFARFEHASFLSRCIFDWKVPLGPSLCEPDPWRGEGIWCGWWRERWGWCGVDVVGKPLMTFLCCRVWLGVEGLSYKEGHHKDPFEDVLLWQPKTIKSPMVCAWMALAGGDWLRQAVFGELHRETWQEVHRWRVDWIFWKEVRYF